MSITKWGFHVPIWSFTWICPLTAPSPCSGSDTHTQADIHELDTGYLSACRSCALQAAQLLGWKVVRCVDEAGRLRSIQSIHEEIWSLAEPLL